MTYPTLTDRFVNYAIDDFVSCSSPEESHDGWFIQTDYGVLYVPDRGGVENSCLAVSEDGHGWNYCWVMVNEDYSFNENVGSKFTVADVLRSAVVSQDRERIESRSTVSHRIV